MRNKHRRILMRTAICLLLGAVATVIVSWALALTIDVENGAQQSAEAFAGQRWTLTRWDRGGAVRIRVIKEPAPAWSTVQATGAPDTFSAGDRGTAWASATPDGQ